MIWYLHILQIDHHNKSIGFHYSDLLWSSLIPFISFWEITWVHTEAIFSRILNFQACDNQIDQCKGSKWLSTWFWGSSNVKLLWTVTFSGKWKIFRLLNGRKWHFLTFNLNSGPKKKKKTTNTRQVGGRRRQIQ